MLNSPQPRLRLRRRSTGTSGPIARGAPLSHQSKLLQMLLTRTKLFSANQPWRSRPFNSPRTPSWIPGAHAATPCLRAIGASGRRTWRPASRERCRAASARIGTPRCRRACRLCT
uniref:Uncharacterized protein n=1 Tax=Arundo donax TaxID=35708 RepID=A0A0A9GJE0_ARUDO